LPKNGWFRDVDDLAKKSCYLPETNEAEALEPSVLFATRFLKWHNDCRIPTRDGASCPNAHDCALAARLHKR
jgi:hypothetical protein